MRIEGEVFQFHPNCPFEKLQLSDLQKQYMADLRAQNSIQSMTQRYLANGWLVNFLVLYDLVAMLATHHWILNPSVKDYFLKLQLQDSKMRSGKTPVAPTKSNAKTGMQDLLHLPFFRSLQKELSEFLLSQAYINTYSAESYVCQAGESSRDLFVLLKGELGIYTQTTTFKQFISILSESSVFGEAGFLLGEKRTADVIALKTSDVLVIPYQAEVLDRFLNREKAQALQQRFWVQHALLKSDFFKNTPSDCLDALTFSGKIEDYSDQQVVFQQGQMGDSAYVVIQGSLTIMQDGKLINTLPQGSFLGEVALMMNNGKRSATAVAQRNTKLLKIGRPEFYGLLAKNLYLAKEFQILADQRLQKDQERSKRS
jgi:CRP-like cAMP-binding protein